MIDPEQQLAYWARQLKDSSPAELLTDRSRPDLPSARVSSLTFDIDRTLCQNIQTFSHKQYTTPFVVLLAALRIAHFRLTGSEDAAIGTFASSYPHDSEFDGQTYASTNMQCIRIAACDTSTLVDLVQQVQSTTAEARVNQDVSFERVCSAVRPGWADASRHPLVQITFTLDSSRVERNGTEPYTPHRRSISSVEIAPPDIEIHMLQESDKIKGHLTFATDLFEVVTIQNLLTVFQEILRRALEQPVSPIAALPIVEGIESIHSSGLLEIEKPEYPRDSSIVDIFHEQVAAAPGKVAVKDAISQMTYSELDRASDELANWLRRRSMPAETLVGVLMPRSCQAIVSFIGVLKANLAYLPLDANAPPARIDAILSASGSRMVLLGDNTPLPEFDNVNVELVRFGDALNDSAKQGGGSTESSRPSATNLAYVLFTSGSTGKPKGVMIEHRGIVRLIKSSNVTAGLPPKPVVAHLTNLAFDVSMWEIYTALLTGGMLVCVDFHDLLNCKVLETLFVDRNVSVGMFSPALLKYYLGAAPGALKGLKVLYVAGDRFDENDAKEALRQLEGCMVYNAYGPTENSVLSTVYNISADDPLVNCTPIGQAVSNSGAYVMDIQQNLVSMGVMGELVVTGDGLARGYKEPMLDVGRFVQVSVDGKAVRAYRTGDRVRRRPTDGMIEFFGRMDRQIKIRGHRIELSEVEHVILSDPSIRDVAVVIRAIENRDPDMVAFAVVSSATLDDDNFKKKNHHGDKKSSSQALQAYAILKRLRHYMPSYMIPAEVVLLDSMPLNANGKVDRQELSQRARVVSKTMMKPLSERVPPRDEIEAALCEEFTAILGIDVGVSDSFFDLGGHSLMATRLAARASRRLNTYISVKDVFDHPVVADLANIIRKGSSTSLSYSAIPSTEYHGPVEQSFAQGRLWFLDQLQVQASWYLIPLATRLRGSLNVEALNTALNTLVERHETLRTTFKEQGGTNLQVVHAYSASELRVIDLSSSADIETDSYLDVLQREQTIPFDLTSETGWRVSLLRLGKDHHVLSIVMHHIISDGWSLDVLRRELGRFYSAALRGQNPLSTVHRLPIQYRDFSVWQKKEDQAAEHKRQLLYWTQQLADSTPAELLADRPRPPLLSGQAGVVKLTIEGELYEKLQTFSQSRRTTPFVVLLTAFRATHFRLTGSDDAMIGRPIANRNRSELEDMIGFFVNTQCIRITVNDDDTFENLVQRVRTTTTEAHENQDVPFERIVSALLPGSRDTSKTPLVQLDFALHSQTDLNKIQLEGVEGELLQGVASTRTDVEFHMYQGIDRLNGQVLFATDLFELDTIQNMVDVFQEMLRRGLDQPLTPIATMPLTDGLDRLNSMGLLDINRIEYPRESSIVDVFRQQVAANPNAIAVKDGTSQISYSELDHQSEALARWLLQQHQVTAAETLIPVLAPRSCQSIISFIAVLKANLAYLPLDTNAPPARIRSILSNISGNKLMLLGDGVPLPDICQTDVELVRISDALNQADRHSSIGMGTALPVTPPSATSLAYVLFTSGSTGKPKGVMVEHRGVVRLVKCSPWIQQLPKTPRVAYLSNPAFDVSIWEIFTALLTGGTLVCVPYTTILDTEALDALFASEQIQASSMTPAILKLCLASAPAVISNLEVLCIGGDRLDPDDARRAQALAKGSVYNAYGPTENSVDSVLYKITDDPFTNGTPIGQAIGGSGAYIMDPQQRIVPIGVMGELVVTGDGVARGYTDTALDVGRFVEVEINGKSTRAYRTGDRARWRPKDGLIEFFGRMDRQVKIRGHRIELPEVEHTILGDSHVLDSAVVIRSAEGQEPEMVGFVTVGEIDEIPSDEATDQVDGWGSHFETSVYNDVDKINHHAVGSDFVGWVSMYDDSPIDKVEMQEWLEDTLHTILNGGPAGRVLEIGTGTGMMMFNLGDGLSNYIGLEPSRTVAEFVNKTIAGIPALADKAQVHVGTATDVRQLDDRLCRPEVALLNSVVQYFPSPEYLVEVFDLLSRIPSVERIVFGDIRSNALNEEFLASRALRLLNHHANKDEVRRKMAEIAGRDEELLVDPAFFTNLATRFPDRVRHVEVLPKRMRATNELSSYRYAAVVHLHHGHGSQKPAQPIFTIAADAWIDFQATSLDREGLVQLLRESSLSNASLFALANVPNSKSSVERHIVQSLHSIDEEKTPQDLKDKVAWISAAREKAEHSVSLSAWDLVQIGKQQGFSVELSCARQRSQSGALDAVFHRQRQQTTSKDARVIFQFPVESKGQQQSSSLTTQPLYRRQTRQVGAQIRKRLQELLPAYMVPSQIIVLEEMPVNANGKVDRRELDRMVQVVPKDVHSSALRILPSDEVEAAVCEEFTAVLGIDVGISDNFFELGGHSLMATRLAARASRRLDTHVSVKDIFDHPIPANLARHIRTSRAAQQHMQHDGLAHQAQKVVPFSLLSSADPSAFVHDIVAPQVKQHHSGTILDVYPATHTQKTYLHEPSTGRPRTLVPFFVDFPSDADIGRIRQACAGVVQQFDIFRTVFMSVSGRFYQIVLDSIESPVPVIDVEEDVQIGDATRVVLDEDKQRHLRVEESLLRFVILRKPGSPIRLVLRISHALYDGLSFETLIHALHALYADKSLSEAPKFARYIRQTVESREAGFRYWRSVLSKSSMTEIPSTYRHQQQLADNGAWYVHKQIRAPVLPRSEHGITQATLFTAACALLVAKLSGSHDVVFGRDVSGRQCLPVDSQHIVGPCTNTVPVRLRTNEGDMSALLLEIQRQYVGCLPFETLDLDDIRDNCTDWPAETAAQYGCCTAFHNFELRPESRIGDEQIHLGDLLLETGMEWSPIYGLEMEAYASSSADGEADTLHVVVQIGRSICDEPGAKRVLDDLCDLVTNYTAS